MGGALNEHRQRPWREGALLIGLRWWPLAAAANFALLASLRPQFDWGAVAYIPALIACLAYPHFWLRESARDVLQFVIAVGIGTRMTVVTVAALHLLPTNAPVTGRTLTAALTGNFAYLVATILVFELTDRLLSIQSPPQPMHNPEDLRDVGADPGP